MSAEHAYANQPDSPKNNSPFTLFRGGYSKLAELNPVKDFDLAKLVEFKKGLNPNVQDSYFFSVRGQLTWFRWEHKEWPIISHLEKYDGFVAVVRVCVYMPGSKEGDLPVQQSYGMATTDDDYPVIPNAQSKAISAALEALGFGCQLDVKTTGLPDYEDTPKSAPEGPAPVTPGSPAADLQLVGAPAPRQQPDPINGSLMVAADTDLSENNPQGQPAVKQQRRSQGGKQGKDQSGGQENQQLSLGKGKADKASDDGDDGQLTDSNPGNLPAVQSNPDAGEPKVEAPESVPPAPISGAKEEKNNLGDPGEQGPPAAAASTEQDGKNTKDNGVVAPGQAQKELQDAPGEDCELSSSSPEQPADGQNERSADDFVHEYIVKMADIPVERFDPEFFGTGTVDPEAMHINGYNAATMVPNKDLQRALEYLQEHPEFLPLIKFPGKKDSIFVGQLFADVLKDQPATVSYCAMRYYAENAVAYAAALLLDKQLTAQAKEGEGTLGK